MKVEKYKKINKVPTFSVLSELLQMEQVIFMDNHVKKNSNNVKKRKLKNEELKNYVKSKILKFNSTDEAILNTLYYLFFYIRSGIYCEIKNNVLSKIFIFVNPDFENDWSPLKFRGFKTYNNMNYEEMIRSDPDENLTVEEYQKFKAYFLTKLAQNSDPKAKSKKEENYLPIKNWWCNAFIVNNVSKKFKDSPIIGDAHCDTIVNFLTELCETSKIKDCRFFLNKRDHPTLKNDLKNPYNFVILNIL